ncbi:hypothetical protein [Cohnella lupini]|uniref:Uncharacterized protein n=1 Tax=Cohnella lupini TaxID=1294267 RepID=A0A3D9IVF8_9BACL|nr:hypothetical protein [Cohnella lupini]RED65823.1 hypothetical protein DFP95_101315 [Cohnella lupini]
MENKRKFSWKRLLIWSLALIVVLGISGIIAANYAVNKVIDSMANNLVLEEITEPIETEQSVIPTGTNESSSPVVSEEVPMSTSSVQPDNNEPIQSAENTPEQQPSTPGKAEINDTDKAGVYNPEVSVKKANDIKDKVTVSEKVDVTSILMGNLSLSDIKLIQELAGGGMTRDEKREARKVLLDKLSPEEYNTLSKIAKKYGVSQGKTYDQAEEEESKASQ